jgi:hypothetical protein
VKVANDLLVSGTPSRTAASLVRCFGVPARQALRRAGPDLCCVRDFPTPPPTSEEWARVQAQIQSAIKRRLAELPG